MKVMVCTDGSEHSEKAVRIAAQLAKARKSPLLILHIIESEARRTELIYDSYGEQYSRAKSILQKAETIVSEIAPGMSVETRVAVGPITEEICRIAEEEGVQALMIGTTGGTALKRMLLGSVADGVIRYCHCPVTVVR